MILCKNSSFSLKASAGMQISSPCALGSWLPQCPEVSCTGCDVHTHLPDKSLLILRFCGLKSVLREVLDLLKRVHKWRVILGDAPLFPDVPPQHRPSRAYWAASVSAKARPFPGPPDQQRSWPPIQVLLLQRNLLISEHVRLKWKICSTYHCFVITKDRLVNHAGESSGVFRQGQGGLGTPWR